MKSVIIILVLSLPAFVYAQVDTNWGYPTPKEANNLKSSLLTEKNDTLRMAAYRLLGFYYADTKLDSALYFHQQQLALAKKLDIKMWLADAYCQVGYVSYFMGNTISGYEHFMEAKKIAADEKNENSNWHYWVFSNAQNLHDSRISIMAMNYNGIGNLNFSMDEPVQGMEAYQDAIRLGEIIHSGKVLTIVYGNMAGRFENDTAVLYAKKAIQYAQESGYKRNYGQNLLLLARDFYGKQQYDSALKYTYASMSASLQQNNLRMVNNAYGVLVFINDLQHNTDSVFFYSKKMLSAAESTQVPRMFLDAYYHLSYAYSLKNQIDSAYKYEKLSNHLNDSLKNVRIKQLTDFQKSAFNEQLRLKQLNDDEAAYQNKLKLYGAIGGLMAVFFVALILYRSNRQKQKSNTVLEKTLTDLKSTQNQLIQSEKMASLGELTAGIAHEIQNPLNFVNNFSEVNTELIDELEQEINKGNLMDVKAIAKDIRENEQKINHHGKRADAIVKGMLQHSRSNSGEREPTNINTLADEYLRLAYHGLRAKDKTFNANLKTEYDESIGSVNVVSQDIGRVILNLITNALYVVNEKQKQHPAGYEPLVTVSTKNAGKNILISVKDNGSGMPQHVLDKIFQPFFTTKPTGQGTGLGLSLAYDIVKAHGGELNVKTTQGVGSEFFIQLPVA